MSDWLHALPVPWMALAIFGFTYLLAAVIHAGVAVLAAGDRTKSFKAVSSSMLPVLGIIFGLFVAFTAAQGWNVFFWAFDQKVGSGIKEPQAFLPRSGTRPVSLISEKNAFME